MTVLPPPGGFDPGPEAQRLLRLLLPVAFGLIGAGLVALVEAVLGI